jgi:hypothetical protein
MAILLVCSYTLASETKGDPRIHELPQLPWQVAVSVRCTVQLP